MRRSLKAFSGLLLLVVIPTALALLWGLSWAAGDYPECGQGTYFLADLGWVLGGMILGAIVGVVIPVILGLWRRFLLSLPVLAAAGVGMLVAGDVGAANAARLVGCSVWGDVADAGEMALLGLAIGAVPSMLIVGTVVGIGWLRRPRPRN
jgi:hypothetical protein